MCVFGLFPIISFFVVFMSPESPHWLIFNGRHEDALKSLTILRGKNNAEIINTEFGSILRTITEVQSKETDDSELKKYWKILTDPTFLEPFGRAHGAMIYYKNDANPSLLLYRIRYFIMSYIVLH